MMVRAAMKGSRTLNVFQENISGDKTHIMVSIREYKRKVMDYELEGRCPLCNKVMRKLDRNLVCDYKRYTFHFRFYHCDRHGVYVWRGNRHELIDLNKRLSQATEIEDLELEVIQRFAKLDSHMPTLFDYKPVKMKCSYCEGGPKLNGEWEQHYGYLTLSSGEKTIFCPWCSAEIPIEKVRS